MFQRVHQSESPIVFCAHPLLCSIHTHTIHHSRLAFGTDCGIVFEPLMMSRLIARLDSNELLSAVTGFQRIMSSKMQGDGEWELFSDPKGYCLRKLQR